MFTRITPAHTAIIRPRNMEYQDSQAIIVFTADQKKCIRKSIILLELTLSRENNFLPTES